MRGCRGIGQRPVNAPRQPSTTSPAVDDSYVVGTSPAELQRLLRQHQLFRLHSLEAWRRAGLAPGQRVLDVGAGPGAAALELAAAVGPGGAVLALERNAGYVAHCRQSAAQAGLAQLQVLQADVLRDPLPEGPFDLIWCRWVAVFLADAAALVERLAPRLRPGGRMLLLETLDWHSLALHGVAPAAHAAVAGFGEAIHRVIAASGADPVAARRLPGLLLQAGLELERLEPLVVAGSGEERRWLRDVMALMGPDLVRQGLWGQAELEQGLAALEAAGQQPGAFVVGPLQTWIQARRPA